jgi:hypothetical protein
MSDPFAQFFGKSGNSAYYRYVSASQIATQKAIENYKAGIATPDVYIADRTKEYIPTILAEDGKPLTLERRKELMAGKPTQFIDNKLSETDYTALFDKDIEPERIGKSAEKARPPIRIVKAKELDISEILSRSINPKDMEYSYEPLSGPTNTSSS